MTHTRCTRRLALPLAAAVIVASVAACATNPATGKKQLALISESQEIQMGRETDEQVVAQMGLYDDQGLQEYVAGIGHALAAKSERPDLPWAFRVVDDPVVNAFALPGGFIYVTRGILAHMSSEAELAAVLGHEIGHVTARHSVNQLSKQQLLGIGLLAGVVASPEAARYADLLQTGLGLLTLKFSRDDERQADELGLRYLVRGGYDPREMPRVFNMLGRVSEAAKEGGRVPGWLSTHPDPGAREELAAQAIRSADSSSGDLLVGRSRFMSAIDGMVFGPDPREGFFREQRFLHPDLEFELTFPDGWQTANQKQRVIGMGPKQDVLLQVTLVDATSPQAAVNEFLGQEGVDSGRKWQDQVNGLDSAGGAFSATSNSREILGRIAVISYQGRLYQLLAYGLESAFRSQDRAIVAAMGSFKRLTERRALSVKPHRIDIDRLDRPTTLEQLHRSNSVVSQEVLALINGVTPTETMPRGFDFKKVVGEPY